MEKRAKIGENVRRENEEILDAVVFGEARVRAELDLAGVLERQAGEGT